MIRGKKVWTSLECLENIKKYKITVPDLPPGYLLEVLKTCEESENILNNHSLRLLILGGDIMEPEIAESWEKTISEAEDSTLCRTNDWMKYLNGGNIEFLGKSDHKVKIRGYRIEQEEIEPCLFLNPSIKDVWLWPGKMPPMIKHWRPNVVLEIEHSSNRTSQILKFHKTIQDYFYTDEDLEDITFNISGWNSSYTGEPIPAPEMRSWVNETVEEIMALNPDHILEIGCGSGLLL